MELLESRIAPAALIFAKQLANHEQGSNLIATDAQANIFVAGVFAPEIDIDLGPAVNRLTTSDAAGDVFIAKYAPDGSLLWAKSWGGAGEERPTGLAVDAGGNVFVTGSFLSSNAGFGGTGTFSTTGASDVFVLKLSSADGAAVTAFDGDGQLQFGGTNGDSATSLALDTNGHLIVGGAFSSADAGFNGPGPFASGGVQAGFAFRISSTSGAVDAGFSAAGGGGVFTAPFVPTPSSIQHVLVNASNDIFLGLIPFGTGVPTVLKLSGADGTPDGVFNPVTSPVVHAVASPGNFGLALQAGGRLLLGDAVELGFPTVFAFSQTTGNADPSFNFGAVPLGLATASVALATDSRDNVYIAGVSDDGSRHYIQRLDANGVPDFNFGNFGGGLSLFGDPYDPDLVLGEMGIAIDASDNLVLRGTYTGSPDLDPTNGVVKLKPRADVLATPNLVEGFLIRFDPFGLDQKNLLVFNDINFEPVVVQMQGPGRARYELVNDVVTGLRIDTLELFGTDLTTKLTIQHQGAVGASAPIADTTVNQIFTAGANQHVGSIILGPYVLLGDGINDALVDLRVTGKLTALQIDGINANAYLKLGEGLPYDVPNDTKTPDTYNMRPNLTVGDVLGAGVNIEVLGNGIPGDQPGSLGGGGFGKITFGSWEFPGFLRTTQSIGDFTVKNGDFFAALEIDKFHVGALTQANVGNMTIQDGAWGGSGTEIEGDVKSFSAEAFLQDATITAASIGSVKITAGAFDGTLILTDPDSPAVPTFTVSTDFTGSVVSASSIKKLNIKGDFTGSLTAPSIGAITAFSFLGTHGVTHITATVGSLGLITSTAGVVKDYEIVTDLAFSGFKVNLGKLTADTAGIDNVKITAASIGNISVSLAAAATSTGVDLVGIRNSQFVTTGTGTTKGTIGKLGNVSVTLKGVGTGASAIGIQNSTFDARVLADEFGLGKQASSVNSLGSVAVKISGSGGHSVGLDHAVFEGDTIGAIKISASRKDATGTGRDVETATLTATKSIGALSFEGDSSTAQVSGLKVWAGASVGNVTIKAKLATNGTLADSAILAGQSLVLTGTNSAGQLAALALAKLGAINLSGSLTNTDLIAGGSIGAVTAGTDMSDSLILAGAMLGGDFAIGGNETYQRAAAIAAVLVKGSFTQSSIVAGVNPGDGVFGNGDDTIAAAVSLLTNSSAIGLITLSGGSTGPSTATHQFAIQAAALTGLKLGAAPAIPIPSPLLLDLGVAGEDAADVLVRVLV